MDRLGFLVAETMLCHWRGSYCIFYLTFILIHISPMQSSLFSRADAFAVRVVALNDSMTHAYCGKRVHEEHKSA